MFHLQKYVQKQISFFIPVVSAVKVTYFFKLVTVTVTSSKKELVTGKSYMSRNVTSYCYKVTLKFL